MTMIEGGCLCGAVRYVARAEPLVIRACWCRVCQYIAAGNATVNLAFPSDAVTTTGELRDYPPPHIQVLGLLLDTLRPLFLAHGISRPDPRESWTSVPEPNKWARRGTTWLLAIL